MEKIKGTINLLKIMLQTSYDTSSLIDNSTNRINKKSVKFWLLISICTLVIYLSNLMIGELKEIGVETLFLEIFFAFLQIIVVFQAILFGTNVMYFSEDIENYLHLPISNIKLQLAKFIVMMSIIFGTELTLVLPSLYVYGIRVEENILLYPVLLVLVLFFISIFFAVMVLLFMIPVMRILRFVKNKYLYQNILILIMTVLLITPMTIPLLSNEENIESEISISEYEEVEEKEQLTKISDKITKVNKTFLVTEWGIETLKENSKHSFMYILNLFILDIIVLISYFLIGKMTYTKDILWCLSLFDKKKKNQINLKKKCKLRNNKISFIRSDIIDIIKNPTFFMHYIYNVFLVLGIIIELSVLIIPAIRKTIVENVDKSLLSELSFDFMLFSIIIGIIQVMFTVSPISLTAISRYGKNAIFFKYIPIKLIDQFRMKNIPQISIGTIIIIVILITIHYLLPEIDLIYLLYIFVISMLLNIIYSYILLLIDLKNPQLNNENEISVLQQNDNKLFKYIVTAIICFILWYIYQVTKEINMNMAIIIEIIVFSIIMIILEVIVRIKRDSLFKNVF